MYHHGVAVPNIGDELRQFRAVSVLARGVVGERAMKLYAGELTIGLLVERADPYITDKLAPSNSYAFILWREV
jgi:hypothetical protein